MRLLGYIRVSTTEQSRDGVSLAMQRRKIETYCELHGLMLTGIIEDAGLSAKDIEGRPGFQEALNRVYGGEADALICWKLDRAFRRTQDALAVAKRLNEEGKALISICEKLDTSSAIGEFFFTLLASLAQMERRLIGERTSVALRTKVANGERVGRPAFGWRVQDGEWTEDPLEQSTIERIRELRQVGKSQRVICETLETEGLRNRSGTAFTQTMISRILRSA